MIIWFASGNAHKKQELQAILPNHTIRTPADAGLDFAPEETGSTFLENALIKARALSDLVNAHGTLAPGTLVQGTKVPVIADDSGLCVDALAGRPGINSARYGGGGTAGNQTRLLLGELGDNPNRRARFVCAMVLLFSPDRFFAVQETLEGEIVREARGEGGFGYDPILRLPEFGRTVAELSEEEKNRISHRGKAGRAIATLLAGD
ncbi:non-canonical purine NTP pyrophosphatase [Spirochaetia bacterium]|nr:non-canonical purine NTP pyrophosphatase [Spirochaetia bacterium]